MKRPIFIIIGAILVLILIGVWIYVLFFSAPPEEGGINISFPFGGEGGQVLPDPGTEVVAEPIVDVTGDEILRQLTTVPVVGYQEVFAENGSSTNQVLYIEAGTGHIFLIDLETGEEQRVSGTTFSQATHGAITPDGRHILVQSGLGLDAEVFVGEISTSSEAVTTTKLDGAVIDFTASADNTFFYAIRTDNAVIAHEYFPISAVSDTLFTIPFREAVIAWGNTKDEAHFIYPKASSQLRGYVYQADGDSIKRLPIAGNGLTAYGTEDYVIASRYVDSEYQTTVYNLTDNTQQDFFMNILAEKCTHAPGVTSEIICMESTNIAFEQLPDAWYRGTLSLQDNIWSINGGGGATMLANVNPLVGRQLDIVAPVYNNEGSRLYFKNKQDDTLWVLETPLAEQ